MRKKRKDAKIDRSVDLSFPASDAPASKQTTGTEAPKQPSGRQAPVITKE